MTLISIQPRVAALAGTLLVGLAQAVTVDIKTLEGTAYTTPTVSEALNGAGMVGMTVTACLATGCDTKPWVNTTETAGSASGAGWSLGLDGDSFTGKWVFDGGGLAWTSFSIDGRNGNTTFDMVGTSTGTPGSESGKPFAVDLIEPFMSPVNTVQSAPMFDEIVAINVLYTDILYLGDAVFDDLFTVMTVNLVFGEGNYPGFGGRLEFFADTDRTGAITKRDPTVPVPAPATLALVGIGLLGLAASRRKAFNRS